MKILVKDNIVLCVVKNSFEIFDKYSMIDGVIYNNIDASDNIIDYDYLVENMPVFYNNQCYSYDDNDPTSMTLILEKENDVVELYKNKYLFENDTLYNKCRISNYYDDNDIIYDTTDKFRYFIDQNIEILKNNTNNNSIIYTYDNKNYTTKELLKQHTIINKFHFVCYDKKIEIMNLINNLSSIFDLESFPAISDLWPAENQKLNLDGTISDIVENKFKLVSSVNKNIIDADGVDEVNLTLVLEYNGDVYTAADGLIWYVPVLGIDGNQIDLVEAVLNSGVINITWSTNTKGIYSFRLDLVRPIPKASLPENIEVIAK